MLKNKTKRGHPYKVHMVKHFFFLNPDHEIKEYISKQWEERYITINLSRYVAERNFLHDVKTKIKKNLYYLHYIYKPNKGRPNFFSQLATVNIIFSHENDYLNDIKDR